MSSLPFHPFAHIQLPVGKPLAEAKGRVGMGFLFKADTQQYKDFLPLVIDRNINLEQLTDEALAFQPEEYAPHLLRKINGNPYNADFRAFVRSLLQGIRSYAHQRQPWFYEREGHGTTAAPPLQAEVLLLRAVEEHNQAYQDAMRSRIGVPRGEFERYPHDYHWGAVTSGHVDVQLLDTNHLLMCTTHPAALGAAVDAFFRRLDGATQDVGNWHPEADFGAC